MIATDISWGAAASALIGQQQLFKQEQVMNSKLIPFGWNYFLALACPSPGALYALYVALLIADMDGFVQECSDFQSTLWERFCFRITAISASVHWKLSTWAKTVWRGLWGGRSSCEGLFSHIECLGSPGHQQNGSSLCWHLFFPYLTTTIQIFSLVMLMCHSIT